MKLVVDASVALKWFIGWRANGQFVDEAQAIAAHLSDARLELFAPSHWIAEVAAVLARSEPRMCADAIGMLYDIRPRIVDSAHVLRRAADLAVELEHHLFDTLYHAVAIECDATLVTADDRYSAKASPHGHIIRLMDFRPD